MLEKYILSKETPKITTTIPGRY